MQKKIVGNYTIEGFLGSGQYAEVFEGRNLQNDSIVAIKAIDKMKFKKYPRLEEFIFNEISV